MSRPAGSIVRLSMPAALAVQIPMPAKAKPEEVRVKLGKLVERLRFHMGPFASITEDAVGVDVKTQRPEVYVELHNPDLKDAAIAIAGRVLQDFGIKDPDRYIEYHAPTGPQQVAPVTPEMKDAEVLATPHDFFKRTHDILIEEACFHQGHPERWVVAARKRFALMKMKRSEALKMRIVGLEVPQEHEDGTVTVLELVLANPEYFPSFAPPGFKRPTVDDAKGRLFAGDHAEIAAAGDPKSLN